LTVLNIGFNKIGVKEINEIVGNLKKLKELNLGMFK
jgi:hypothetical protein